MPTTTPPVAVTQIDKLLDAFIAALRDEITAAKSAKGDSITSLSDGRRTQRGADHSAYTFLMDRSVAASDDVPVELDVGGRRYKGSVLYINGDEIAVVVNTTEDLGHEISHAGLVSNLAFLPERLRDRLRLVREGKEPIDVELARRVFLPSPEDAAVVDSAEIVPPQVDAAMNASQQAAVTFTQTQPVSFVWGPPGTGKTHTLARVTEAFLRRGMRVLVVAHSNVAVDEAAMDIANLLHDTPWYQNYEILRLGHHRNEGLAQHDRVLFDQYVETLARRLGSDRSAITEQSQALLDRAKVVCTTLTQVFFSSLFPEVPFDVCIIDEASMAPLPALFWALTRARQYAVLGGDFLQLPPVSLAQTLVAARWLGRNIYQHLGIITPDHARDHPNVSLLDTQYRMHPTIAEIPNQLFYEGVLHTDPGTSAKSGTQAMPLVLVDTSSAAPWCVRLARGSRLNLHSAHVATTLAAQLAGTPPVPGRVAILTPYAAQARLLGAFIRDLNLARCVRVATVHRFQGGEVSIVIFDTVEAPPERPAPMLDDLHEEGAKLLLNVALTRPKETLVVLADVDHLNHMLDDNSSLVRIAAMLGRTGSVVPSEMIIEDALMFRAPFDTDIAAARHEILAIVPAGDTGCDLSGLLEAAAARGVRVALHTSQPSPRVAVNGEADNLIARLPRPLVVIDRRIIWDGVPQATAEDLTQNRARRLVSPRAASALTHAVVTAAYVPGPDGKAAEEVVGTQEACPECGGLLQAVIGTPHVVLVCQRAPECTFKRRLRKKDSLATDRMCPSCGQPMMLRSGLYGPFLSCSRYPRCKKTINLGHGRG
ncbi:MAG TPA: AAA domain-containing protein [bacterium]|nr:AAA domain-containing protein [bacterium]